MFDLFEPAGTAVAIHTPLDHLFAEYRKKREDIERIAAYVRGETDVFAYFMSGAQKEHNYGVWSATTLFNVQPAVRSLDASFWARAMSLTDVLECMPADKRNAWSKQIHDHITPPFELDSVRATLQDLLAQRATFFAERVDGLFRALSDEHLTNAPNAFGRRMILRWMLSYCSINHDQANYIHDLRCVIAKFMGRDDPPANITYRDLDRIHSGRRHGEWHSFDGGALRIKLFKKGTAHLEVNAALAWRLNSILAHLHPLAIPPEFRQPSAKKVKQHDLDYDLLSYETIGGLMDGRINQGGTRITFHSPVKPSVERVLKYLGGINEGLFCYVFDYNITRVLEEVQRTGSLPEQKTHQYYPTPDQLAQRVVDRANIEDHHSVLEPSAGQGGIADKLPIDQTTCVEISALHCAVLKAKGHTTTCTDFLAWHPGRLFDRIAMNPPFADKRAVDHVRHAASLLSPDGRLVAIMPASYRNKTVLDGWQHEWSDIYDNEFKGAGVSVVIVVLTRTTCD